MKPHLLLALALLLPAPAGAHPMGNFSVNHYAHIQPARGAVQILYVLDFAELPTLQLMQKWELTKESPKSEWTRKVRTEAAEWVRHLQVSENGSPVRLRLEDSELALQDGAGGLPVLRVASKLRAEANGGRFWYEDQNFVERAGWKEIVIRAGARATLSDPGVERRDRSSALTAYPQDPTVAPPQELQASFEWRVEAPVISQKSLPVAAPAPAPALAPAAAPAALEKAAGLTGATPPEQPSLGTVRRNDFLSVSLKNSKESLPFGLALTLLAVAFGIGALHAAEPGHGKTMVAAYLVGSRGTFRHAAFLGGMVTFTHTVSVFLLGAVTLFLSQYILPETLTKVMGTISGVSIIWIGGLLLYRRAKKLWAAPHAHGHGHDHAHEHGHDHPHVHGHDHAHPHDHEHAHGHERHHGHEHGAGRDHDHSHGHEHAPGHEHEHAHPHGQEHAHGHYQGHHHAQDHSVGHSHVHTKDGHTHSHVPEGEVTIGSLIALGVTGGLVPCPAALVILLSCISIGRPGFGMLLLLAFSLGLALVLMLIGFAVLAVKNAAPKRKETVETGRWVRWAPAASAAVILLIGVYMTGVAMGAFPVIRGIG